ncbi:MAG TPA: TIGR02301 family protein [Vitreimonas sp.]|jgi:uncharacterized protein (TIGR02301 family)|nr:TIGR02301 family protein [Vitreimonas sp.]
MISWRFPLAFFTALSLGGTAAAQVDVEPTPQAQSDNENWYHGQLLDLSEVLGGTHYLATLCSGQGDQRWRDAMRSVIQRAPQYSDELVEAFNRGYGMQQSRFPDCDQSAQQMTTELRARGLRISQALAARHTN